MGVHHQIPKRKGRGKCCREKTSKRNGSGRKKIKPKSAWGGDHPEQHKEEEHVEK